MENKAPGWEQMKEVAEAVAERALSQLSESDQAILSDVKKGAVVDVAELEQVTSRLDAAIATVATRLNVGESKGGSYIDTLQHDTMGRERLPNEIDMIERFHGILSDCGHSNPDVIFDSQHIRDVLGKNSNIQQMNINRFLMFLASDAANETRIERYLLQDNTPVETWLDNLKKVVVPGYIALGIL